jgi:hypothetical protein
VGRWWLQYRSFISSLSFKAQRSLYVPHSGQYMYGTAVTICTAQRSLYVPHSGHYMYRTAVTICIAQRSIYVPHSGHYMYRTAVTICTAQRSIYVPPGLTFTILRSAHTAVFMCFVWISKQTAIISLYSINWLVFITETECVYCAVRTGYLSVLQSNWVRGLTRGLVCVRACVFTHSNLSCKDRLGQCWNYCYAF